MLLEECAPPTPIATARIVSPLWRLVARHANPIALLHDGDALLPFYCVHPISGDVTGLQTFAAMLGAEQRVYGIQVPREKMNAVFGASIESMARHHVEALFALQPSGPVVLGGWSAGAIIALEMAEQLRARDRDVSLLVAFDGAPCNTGAGLKPWTRLYLWRLLLNAPSWIKDDLKRHDWSWRGIVRRLDSKLAYRFQVELPTLKRGQTLDVGAIQTLLDDKGWLKGQRAFIHAVYEAMLAYVARPYAGPVVVYETQTQPLYHLRQIAETWRHIAGRTVVVRLAGTHSGLFEDPAVGMIAADLRDRLAALRQQDTPPVPE